MDSSVSNRWNTKDRLNLNQTMFYSKKGYLKPTKFTRGTKKYTMIDSLEPNSPKSNSNLPSVNYSPNIKEMNKTIYIQEWNKYVKIHKADKRIDRELDFSSYSQQKEPKVQFNIIEPMTYESENFNFKRGRGLHTLTEATNVSYKLPYTRQSIYENERLKSNLQLKYHGKLMSVCKVKDKYGDSDYLYTKYNEQLI